MRVRRYGWNSNPTCSSSSGSSSGSECCEGSGPECCEESDENKPSADKKASKLVELEARIRKLKQRLEELAKKLGTTIN